MPEQAPGAKRVLVPESLWIFLYENSNLVKPDDQLGCSTFPSDAETCTECRLELTEVASWEDTLRLFGPVVSFIVFVLSISADG